MLSRILRNLEEIEGYRVTLVGGSKVRLKAKGGPINRSFSHFLLQHSLRDDLEVWTDVEFLTMSHRLRGAPANVSPGDHHELVPRVGDCLT